MKVVGRLPVELGPAQLAGILLGYVARAAQDPRHQADDEWRTWLQRSTDELTAIVRRQATSDIGYAAVALGAFHGIAGRDSTFLPMRELSAAIRSALSQ